MPSTAALAPPGAPSDAWHALAPAEVASRLSSSAVTGLSSSNAARRRERDGSNVLPDLARRGSAFSIWVRQFASPLIYLLFIAAAVAFFLGESRDAAVILVVVVVNAMIGAFQEGRAERSMAALRRLTSTHARLVRDGIEQVVDARELVPGDVLLVAAGDAIAADARLIEAARLTTGEAALTGESEPVAKDAAAVALGVPLAERRNMLYAGTHVAAGRGRAMVVATGARTELGGIAALTQASVNDPTPLERRIAQFGRYLTAAAVAVFLLVVVAGMARGLPFGDVLMVGISQLVSTVPEGLPVVMTIALAVGMRRMAEHRAIVRRLAAVESLGSTSVICTDKTGTLTRNEMTATAVYLPDGRHLGVTGNGYAPEGRVTYRGEPLFARDDRALRALLEAALLCNDAALEEQTSSAGTSWTPLGDPTEAALVALAAKAGLSAAEVRASWARAVELPFDADRKMMATAHRSPSGLRVIVKGAPESILPRCACTRGGEGDRAVAAAEAMAAEGLRVLAFAEVPDGALTPAHGFDSLGSSAEFLGLVGQRDPPRDDAAAAVRRCQGAGIRIVMVTGDHPLTGSGVARAVGIAGPGDAALHGAQLDAMPEDAARRRLPTTSVFARVHPAQKLRIVEMLQGSGAVVAMTGDGVNDAPALARADVGVAMGLSGTEVAREAADIVLTDDRFGTLVQAVAEGRLVYANLRKAILVLFSTGLAEVAVLVLAMLAGYPLPFLPVQILWNNLVTEGTITVNLAMEPADGDEMRRPPIARDEPIVNRAMLGRMLGMAATITAVTLGYFGWMLAHQVPLDRVRTAAFTLLPVCEWFNLYNCRSESRSAFAGRALRNPWLTGGVIVSILLQLAVVYWAPLQRAFHTVPLSAPELLRVCALGSIVLWVEEARKLVARR